MKPEGLYFNCSNPPYKRKGPILPEHERWVELEGNPHYKWMGYPLSERFTVELVEYLGWEYTFDVEEARKKLFTCPNHHPPK